MNGVSTGRSNTHRLLGVTLMLAVAYGIAVGLTGAVDFARPAAAESGIEGQAATGSPEAGHVPGQSLGNTSDAEIWRRIRGGAPGTVSIPQSEAAVLIQSEGEEWRSIRNGPVTTYGASIMLGVIALAALYFVVRGRIRIAGGRSGRHLVRFTLTQRIIHWFTAVLFVLLGLSGLVLLYGKHVLIPALGPAAFGAIASAALQAHNLFGPLFIVAIVALFFGFLKGNGYRPVDLTWFARLGGFFGGHARAGLYNAGEKSWFWAAVLLGLILSASGLLLDFPFLAPDRQALQLANLAHSIAAMLFIAFGLGHIYLGTVGMEGALESMTRGEVDANWAKEHHDIWHDEVTAAEAPASDGQPAEVRG